MTDISDRRVPVYVLIHYRNILDRLASFCENISGCNFTLRTGWQKTYIENHGVGDHKPEIRGVDVLNFYHIILSDMVILTEDQYNDFRKITMLGHPDIMNVPLMSLDKHAKIIRNQ